jgi:hypothetical protein
MPAPVWPRPSSSQLARYDRTELQSPTAERLVGIDVAVAQCLSENILNLLNRL